MQGGGRRFDPGQLHHPFALRRSAGGVRKALALQLKLDDPSTLAAGFPKRKPAGSVEAAAGGKPGLIDN